MVGAATGSRTAPKGGSVPEPPLCILLLAYATVADSFLQRGFPFDTYDVTGTWQSTVVNMIRLTQEFAQMKQCGVVCITSTGRLIFLTYVYFFYVLD